MGGHQSKRWEQARSKFMRNPSATVISSAKKEERREKRRKIYPTAMMIPTRGMAA